MIAYLLGVVSAPVIASAYTAACRLSLRGPNSRMRHARSWSTPHPWRQWNRGTHVQPRGRHEYRPVLAEVTL